MSLYTVEHAWQSRAIKMILENVSHTEGSAILKFFLNIMENDQGE